MVVNFEQFADGISKLPQSVRRGLDDYVSIQLLRELASLMTQRISEGKDSSLGKIGDYSTKPLYAYREQLAQEKVFVGTKGGTGKTMRFDGGYKELRRMTDRTDETVNLKYKGDLLLSVQSGWYGGIPAIAIVGKDSIEKAEGNEKRFNKTVFEPSQDEINLGEKVFEELVKNLFSQF